MLHLLGKGQAPEWNEDKHDIEEVFALLCYRGIHYAKWVCIDVVFTIYNKVISGESTPR